MVLFYLSYDRDDTVEVGAALYEIDTDAEPSASTQAAPTSNPAKEYVAAPPVPTDSKVVDPVTQPKAKAAPLTESSSTSSRQPSIHFLGKDGWAQAKSGQKDATPAAPNVNPLAITVIRDDALHPMYGRPPFSDEEMDALMFGGANLVEGM
jgi:pyruvate/2-oxoglutarate dehydrogenase complex dihydrolipoamide acyltransferase (E2) component